MTDPIRVIRNADLIPADPTPGMDRSRAFEVSSLWAGKVVTQPGSTSGWHHHDRNETSLYIVSGLLRLEFEGYDGHLDAVAGDFVHVPAYTVHRESNPTDEPSVAVIARAGGGVPTVNVEDPQGGPVEVNEQQRRKFSHDRELRGMIRGAMFRADGEALIALLSQDSWPADSLQLVGDALLAVLAQDLSDADRLAHECLALLSIRDWPGDDVLAVQLESALGDGSASMLKPLPVEPEFLSDAIEGDPNRGRSSMDLQTGWIFAEGALDEAVNSGDYSEEDVDDPERWIRIRSEGSSEPYHDMELFIDTVTEPDVADLLRAAVEGRGAFQRFRDLLTRWPDLQSRFYAMSDDRKRGRARQWLADAGYFWTKT